MFCAPELIFDCTEGVPFSCFAPRNRFGRYRERGSRFLVLPARTHFRQFRVRRDPFSCFAHLDSFFTVPRASRPVFILCAPGLVIGGTGGVGYRFLVLRLHISFRRCRGRRVPFSCFALLDSFSAIPRASSSVFFFCTPGLFRRYRGRRVTFSYFALPESFFGGTGVVGSHFHVLSAQTNFQRYQGLGSRFLFLRAMTLFQRYRGRPFPF
jgi:hypothetical protein